MDFFNMEQLATSAVAIGGKILLILIVFALLAPIGRRVIHSSMNQLGKRQNLTEGRKQTLEKLLLSIYTYVLFFIFLVMILGAFDLDIGPMLAAAGIVGLAIGFGAQGIVSDVVTGFFILVEKQIDVDDYITAGGENGIVEELGLRTTQVRGFDGTLHFIPNRNILNVNNHSRGNMRALVDIGISYDASIDEAMVVLQRVCDDLRDSDERIKDGPNVVGVQSIGSSDIVLRILAQTKNMEQWGVEREIRKRIKEALDEAGIDIPFPHQEIIMKNDQD
ncbi:mechanosensitive ion channel protein [Halalkalibacillus sediminis]|uniref:Mechanosensitive ion channel protein n=1 Tax=Halalkalibacillus sediminis TaxID=2018042 RepID=A0A2I0QWJ5_9BACI|nr:mechanosensitive ion channel family protein [Halalkalibacillus sediminis]PKR78470.1 mechanosensitive ion channel protein [Halalkalibacillus sediminis]